MKDILREIGMIERCFESIANIEFKEYGLAKNQYIYLVRICENPGIIQERITDMLKVDRSTASRSIEKLKKAGLIIKRKDKENRKNLKLYPTESGIKIFTLLKREEEYSDRVALKDFTAEEVATLLIFLKRIRNNIEPDWELVKKGGTRAYLKGYFLGD